MKRIACWISTVVRFVRSVLISLTRTSLHRLQLAYLYPPDLRRLLKQAGFTLVQIAGGFDGRPFGKDTDELVIEAALD